MCEFSTVFATQSKWQTIACRKQHLIQDRGFTCIYSNNDECRNLSDEVLSVI